MYVRKAESMTTGTVTVRRLSQAVTQRLGLPMRDSTHLIRAILTEVIEELVRGENVYIYGFGSLQVRRRFERQTTRPGGRIEVITPNHTTIVFCPTEGFLRRVNPPTQPDQE